MISVRSPLRISFGGGGTDLPAYYERFGGMVVSAAISPACHVSLVSHAGAGVVLQSRDFGVSVAVPSQRQVVIRENNITTTGGAIVLLKAEQPMIYNNQCEHPTYLGDYDGRFDAQLYFRDTVFAEVRGNTVVTAMGQRRAPAHALSFDGGSIYNEETLNVGIDRCV